MKYYEGVSRILTYAQRNLYYDLNLSNTSCFGTKKSFEQKRQPVFVNLDDDMKNEDKSEGTNRNFVSETTQKFFKVLIS